MACLVLLAYVALCYLCWWHHRRKTQTDQSPTVEKAPDWLIAYASQSGTAAQLAWQSQQQLAEGGMSAQVTTLNRLTPETLQSHNNILFVISTFGEGEAPDNGSRFLARLKKLHLPHLHYGVLALGDSSYRCFCGFARAVNHALHDAGAVPIVDMVEVDKNDAAALRHWQYYLGQISGQSHFRDWLTPDYQHWTLGSRHCLNTGSPGAPAYWLQLVAEVEDTWCAGDIAEIGPCNSLERIVRFCQALGRGGAADENFCNELRRRELPELVQNLTGLTDAEILRKLPILPHREYSIASIPEAGTLDLLVRQVVNNGELGLGSGWLTHHAPVGTSIALRIRRNPAFHSPAAGTPLILLGNGTGMAGLRVHLWARQRAGERRNWLLFGERTARCDFFFGEQIRAWQKEGFIERVDLAFSRDGQAGAPRYVQDLLPTHADRLRAWVAEGAAIYVCGSLQGMAQGVDAALAEILGREQLDALAEARRYCRDVY